MIYRYIYIGYNCYVRTPYKLSIYVYLLIGAIIQKELVTPNTADDKKIATKLGCLSQNIKKRQIAM